jgi:hypothetical protein
MWVAISAVVWPIFPWRQQVLIVLRLDDSQMVAAFAVAFILARVWPQPKIAERGIG